MAKKIDRKLNGEDIVEKEFGDFLENGGEIGGTITFPKGITRQALQKITVRSKDYTQRSGLSNYNGYPTWSTVIEDPDDDNNTNGLLFMLGSGSGDAYNDNYLRPLKMGYAQKNNLGSATVPWDDIFLKGVSKGTNGYSRLPNGLILQWGTGWTTTDTVNPHYTAFPLKFNTAVLGVVCTGLTEGSSNYVSIVALNVYGFNTRSNFNGHNFKWIAIGY